MIKKAIRPILSALIILIWFAVAGVGGPYFGKVSEVSSNDQTTYLPASAEATQVQKRLGEFQDGDTIPAVAVFVKESPASEKLTEEDLASLTAALEGFESSPAIPSEDGLAAEAFISLPAGDNLKLDVANLRDALVAGTPDGIEVYVTGPAGFTADLINAFSGIDGLLLGVALIAVLLILIIVYRSFLLPVAVLSTSIFALTAALLSVWWLAKAEVLMLNGQTQGILFILVIGAATDYSLLMVARFREEIREKKGRYEAVLGAIKGSWAAILASGGTVIAGLMCLLFSDLKSNSSLGPVASIGIVFAMLAALTLLPAILYALGAAAFWPAMPKKNAEVSKLWGGVANFVSKRPRVIWLSVTAVLALGAVFAGGLQASGVAQSELVLGASNARDGQVALGKHFAGGSGSPVFIITPASQADEVRAATENATGISEVLKGAKESGSDVLLQATLENAADSSEALNAVKDLRADLASFDAIVGGVSATALDTNTASIHDRNLIIPIVLVVITLILMMLLRSVVAPILLVATTVLSFGTALGVAAIFFNDVFKFAGADPAVPLYGFVFLVALGIDYNIFLMTRVREETLKHGTTEGMKRGLTVTGGVITSAGIVLAATFAALSVIPILFLVQIAFIVAFGVLLDTFIVRSLLVPALVLDTGRRVWWPAKLKA